MGLMKLDDMNSFQFRTLTHLGQWLKKYLLPYSEDVTWATKDYILPKGYRVGYPHIFHNIRDDFEEYKAQNYFYELSDFFSLASSQASAINLYLPLVLSNSANEIFKRIISDFDVIDRSKLYKGFQFEFPFSLGLKNKESSFVDVKISFALAYKDVHGDSCLYLFVHSFLESKFYQYPELTSDSTANNTLAVVQNIAFEIEKQKLYDHCYYGLVMHNENSSLLGEVETHIYGVDKKEMMLFDYYDFIGAVRDCDEMKDWVGWFQELYVDYYYD